MNPIKAALQKELKEAGWHSRGYLPHFDGAEISQSVTFRLADSLPQIVLAQWKRELRQEQGRLDVTLRKRIEAYLDQGYGSCALGHPNIATIVQDSILHFDAERYRLSAWVVMPNHVHVLMTPHQRWPLSRIIKDMKSFTSREANKHLGRKGRFWMEDYFDRYIRDRKHFAYAIAYIENNPVKARLCGSPEDWRFSSAWFRARMRKRNADEDVRAPSSH
jgi:REP element-mobilizing transposase RayT